MASSEQKRVLIATPVLLLGGTEIQTLSLVRVLVRAGYHVALCCYYEFDQTVLDQFKEAGVEIFLLKLDRSNGFFGIKNIWELMRKLIHVFEMYHPNIIHIQYLAPGLIPIIAARLSGIPAIFATVHIAGSIVYGLKAKLLLRIAAKLTTVFICVSQGVEKFWFGESRLFQPEKPDVHRKHFTIYNGIDVSKITEITGGVDRDELRNSLGIKDQPVVGIVGRLAHQKGHTILLDALKEVVKEFPTVMLFISGDGPDRAKLEEKAKRLELEKYIRWFGALPQEEVFRLYAAMDVFVMPSLYEGFGLTATEAMAAGLPVVGTRIEGLTEVIEDKSTGCLVPVCDSHELAEALIYLLANPDQRKRMGESGRQRVNDLFSMGRFANTMLFTYGFFKRGRKGTNSSKRVTTPIQSHVLTAVKKFTIRGMMRRLEKDHRLFSAIEIETVNRCNGTCAFCPVNSRIDERPYAEMDEALFRKIIDELGNLDYSGFLGLQSNNEPYLDRNIISRIAYARRNCPQAFIYVYTNGTLLDTDKLLQSIDAGLSEIVINNYHDDFVLNENVKKILTELEKPQDEAYRNKIKIALRKKTEILTNRGGTAPNKSPGNYKHYIAYRNTGCLLPFRQIVVRPDGKISLCCQDALGQVTLGDAKTQSLKEIWNGPPYEQIREQLLKSGRKNLKICNVCDVTAVYRNDLRTLVSARITNYINPINNIFSLMPNLARKFPFLHQYFRHF